METLVVLIVDNEEYNFVICGNAIHIFEVIKYLNRREILLCKNVCSG
jgi:hypothetical protein